MSGKITVILIAVLMAVGGGGQHMYSSLKIMVPRPTRD